MTQFEHSGKKGKSYGKFSKRHVSMEPTTTKEKLKLKEAYLTCQTKLRDEIEREDKERTDNKFKELIKVGGINSNNF